MDLQHLIIENFMSHRYSEIDFTQFQSALIMGQNKANPRESNAVGKSVIFHAIEYGLFGTYPTKTIDLVVREGTDAAKVVINFNMDSKSYRVERKRLLNKTTEVDLYELNGDKWKSISQRTPTETHNLLQTILKINVTSFKNSVQFSQNSLDGLIENKGRESSAEERRVILKEAINLTVYQKYEKLAKKKKEEISKKMDVQKGIIESIGDPQSDINYLNDKIIQTKQILSEKDKEHNNILATIDNKRKELSDLQKLINSEATSIHEKLNDIKTSKHQLAGNIKNIRGIIIDNENKIASLSENKKRKSVDLKELEDRCNDIRAKKRRSISKVKQELESTSQNELNGKAYISSLEGKAHKLKQPIPDGEDCPTCRQELSNEYKDNCKIKIEEELQTVLDEIADKKPKLKKCTNKKIRLQNELEEINKAINYITTLENKITSKEQEINNDEDYINRLNELNSNQKNELDLLLTKQNDLESREKVLEESLSELSDQEVEEKISNTKKILIELETNKHSLMDEINQENIQLGTLNGKIEDKTIALEKLYQANKKMTSLEYECQIYKKVQQAFSSSGIPTMIIHTILDDLQSNANKLLLDLKPGLEIQFTPTLDLIYKHHGKERDFSQLSGGQKFTIALCLKLGLSLVIQKRLGVDIKILLLDEVDQPLDDATVDAYAEALRKLQTKFRILVITHNHNLKDKFSNVIMVEGDHNYGAVAKLVTF